MRVFFFGVLKKVFWKTGIEPGSVGKHRARRDVLVRETTPVIILELASYVDYGEKNIRRSRCNNKKQCLSSLRLRWYGDDTTRGFPR